MKVKLSADAQRDIRQQVDYLTGKTIAGIATFRDTIRRGQRLLQSQPNAGQEKFAIPIRGARRLIVDGWYFDYEIVDGAIWVYRITSSINTPMLSYDDDFDYEEALKPR